MAPSPPRHRIEVRFEPVNGGSRPWVLYLFRKRLNTKTGAARRFKTAPAARKAALRMLRRLKASEGCLP